MVNLEKSNLVLSQSIMHLGVQINTVVDKVFISQDRLQKLQSLLQMVLEKDAVELMILVQILRMMVSCQDVLSWSRLHSRLLQKFLLPYQVVIAKLRVYTLPLLPALENGTEIVDKQ